ncbi:MAG: D-alanyl-D-alanine carboxypeptidase [Mogibacterium sp.]|nr:D-alanyl-D-alanine carboxypeptidase [Mogibacterium sp.]
MTEKHARKKQKKKVRIDFKKAARSMALLILVLTVVLSYLPAAFGRGTSFDRSLIRPCGELGSKAPGIRAQSAIMYSVDLDMPVYEKNADMRMDPYSITKILTCYLALENLDPDDVLTTSKNATKELEDGMELELEPGEKVKMIDLVYACMMMSANDGAIVLAEAVSGSESAFADLMNETVKKWGCENTHFVNPNGWEDPDHYTTARDMAIIVMHCLENETLREISMTKKYTMPATNMSEPLLMENALLKATDNFELLIGGKTGSWSETQCTVGLEFTESGLTAVIVLLGDTAKGRMEDPRTLAAAAHDLTPGFIVTDSDKGVCKAWVRHGVKPTISLDVSGLRYAYPKNQKAGGIKVKTEIDMLEAPVSKGDKVGKYYIYANKKLVGQGYLYAGEDIEKGWLPSYLFISNRTALLSGIMIVLVLLLGEVLSRKSRMSAKASAKRSKSS